jgi:hypothetical protein
MKRNVKRALAHGAGLEMVRRLMGENNMFEFNPKEGTTAWDEGQFEATVEKTEEDVSKKGDPMLKVTYTVYHPSGKTQTLTDYFVRASSDGSRPGNLFRLKALCAAVGGEAEKAFKAGKLDHKSMLRGKNVLLTLGIEESTQYGDRNRVEAYAKLDRRSAQPVAAAAEEDEAVPF